MTAWYVAIALLVVVGLVAAASLSMKRAMAKQGEAERENRAKIIAAQGESLAAGELANASDIMMARPLALQLRNLQTLIEISVDKNSTVVFPAPLMSTINELSTFIAREAQGAAGSSPSSLTRPIAVPANGAGSSVLPEPHDEGATP
jgi:hypothetical protein